MMCQRIGRPPTSTIGFGFDSASSARRVPSPPASRTVFTVPPPADQEKSRGYPPQNVKRLTSRYVPAKRIRAPVPALSERLAEHRISQHALDRVRERFGGRLFHEFCRAGRDF